MNACLRYTLKISKHPLIVLAVGTIVGSLVVPPINSKIDENRRKQEMRAARGVEILKSGIKTEQRFNSVQTEFEGFYKGELAHGTADKKSREVLRERVHTAYKEFNDVAWWWHWETLDEVRALRLLDGTKLQELEQDVKDYQQALMDSTALLDHYWDELLRRKVLVSPEEGAKTFNEVNPLLQQLGERRRKLFEHMAKTIMD